MIWYNVLGDEVDLNKIDREYALNILMHVHGRMAWCGTEQAETRNDELIQELRKVVLSRRRRRPRDVWRAFNYNRRCKKAGYPYRARVF